MSSNTFKKAIERELQKLNEEIDNKIVKGLSYIRESKRHKALLLQLNKFNRRSNLFQRSFNFIRTPNLSFFLSIFL
jgi:hypothetical protein